MSVPRDTAARRLRRLLATLVSSALVATAAVFAVATHSVNPFADTAATVANPITPGNFTGYGFDQCNAPSQAAMTTWRKSSPFRAAGIYISGALRYCQAQPNLTPTWVQTQLAAGWHLLPIHLGAQASCSTKAGYQRDKISAVPANEYAAARAQGRNEAQIAVAAARQLGIVPQSTIYYDLEAFNYKIASCTASSLWFLSAWTSQIHTLGYVSGVYSSAASGIKVLDGARVTPGNPYVMPDQLWIADWTGVADANSTYLRPDGWIGKRIHQYQGGHNETWGGQRINIDRNYLSLSGNAETLPPPLTPEGIKSYDAKCTTASINQSAYRYLSPTAAASKIVPLQCLLKQQGLYTWPVGGIWNTLTTKAVAAWQKKFKHPVRKGFTRADWVSLLSAGNAGTTLKPGVRGPDVFRAQRALNAATSSLIKITGIYDASTQKAASSYQSTNKISPTAGIIASMTWGALTAGKW